MTPEHDLVLVVDYGAQYAQLIARRVREARVYSEIVPHTTPVADLLAREPKAIILSGGPSSVYEPGAPQLDASLLRAEVPVFGICYGFMAMAQALVTAGSAFFGSLPSSIQAARWSIRRAASSSVAMSARRKRRAWKSESGLPNWRRSLT